MRAENAAALTNFLLILLGAVGLMMASSSPNGAYVYANPTTAIFQAAAIGALVGVPLGAVAAWRTWLHARRYLTRPTTGWQGVFEAGALGFALTLPLVLPGVVLRQFNPGEWGQPQALFLGLAYVGAYGLLGLIPGLVLGFLLRLSAIAAMRVHRRVTS